MQTNLSFESLNAAVKKKEGSEMHAVLTQLQS
jgi:hypothetical protein